MAQLQVVDLNLDNIAKVINSIEPTAAQDLTTKNYVDNLSRKRRTTASQSSTSNVFAALTGLTSISLPVGSYAFKAYVKMRSAAAGNGYGLRFNQVSAVVSDVIAQWRLPAGADFSTTQNIMYSQRALNINTVAGTIGAANTDYMAVGEGVFTVTTAGTVTIEMRSENTGTAVTAGINSCLIIEALP
jgi:hypothetical protein